MIFIYKILKRKLWSSGRALGSQSEGRGFDPHPMLDGNGIKAMAGSIPTPNPGSLNKIQAAKWGTPKKVKKRNLNTASG